MIEILGSTGCIPCQNSKQMLNDNNIEFSYYDIAQQTEKVNELKLKMIASGVRSVPAFFKDGKYIGLGIDTAKSLCDNKV